MARSKYIKGKDGKFVGSIGTGKSKVPTSTPQSPAALNTMLTTVAQSTMGRAAARDLGNYDPATEARNLQEALKPANGFFARRAQAKLRNALEARFGAIDWSDTRLVDGATDAEVLAGY